MKTIKTILTVLMLFFVSVGYAQKSSYGPAKTHTYRLHHEKCTLKYQTWVSGVEYNGKYKCFIRVTNEGKSTIKKLYLTIDPSETSLTGTCRLIEELPPGQTLSTWVIGNFEPGTYLPLTILNFQGEPDEAPTFTKEQIEEDKKMYNSAFEKIIYLSDEGSGKTTNTQSTSDNNSVSDKIFNAVRSAVKEMVTNPDQPKKINYNNGAAGVRG